MPAYSSFFISGAADSVAPLLKGGATPNSPMLSGSSMLTEMSSSLLLIIGCLLITLWLVRRFLPKRYLPTGANAIKVIDNYSLGSKTKITIIEVDQQALVLGVTEENISLLHKMPAKTELSEQAEAKSAPPSFGQLIKTCLVKSRNSDA